MEISPETDRLILRRFTVDDVDNLVELDADPEVTHFINGGNPTPREVVEPEILRDFSSITSAPPATGSGR